jgi:hypothetical protein
MLGRHYSCHAARLGCRAHNRRAALSSFRPVPRRRPALAPWQSWCWPPADRARGQRAYLQTLTSRRASKAAALCKTTVVTAPVTAQHGHSIRQALR